MVQYSIYRDSLKRQLELVQINQEKQREIEFKDYKINKLEQELRETHRLMLRLYESKSSKASKVACERICIYG